MQSQFDELSEFILKKMRMSHIYQPVMLITLLEKQGRASINDIARALLQFDDSQIEYYEHITKSMVGRVLTQKRKITVREGDYYHLIGFSYLTPNEVQMLLEYCHARLESYIEKRGDNIWQHRKKSANYISGSIRYEILKRAKFRCELCGISASEKALEVDHILPRNHGGGDEASNLQSLCYSCNAMKRDRDDTDLRDVAASYDIRQHDCVFCQLPQERIIDSNELALAFYDGYPVTEGHTLIIPKRHVVDYFDLYQPERNAIHELIERQRQRLLKQDPTIAGFNIGNNAGETAGQTIMHCHTHLIPRRQGDTQNPRGGVRGVIPNKQQY
jgi:ATP adenylyltransferase